LDARLRSEVLKKTPWKKEKKAGISAARLFELRLEDLLPPFINSMCVQ
jgi:hypothetical protein